MHILRSRRKVKNFGRRIINSGARITLEFGFSGSADDWSKLVDNQNDRYKAYTYRPPGKGLKRRLLKTSLNQFNEDMSKLKPLSTKSQPGGQTGTKLRQNEKKNLGK